jgi:hypothetical protein
MRASGGLFKVDEDGIDVEVALFADGLTFAETTELVLGPALGPEKRKALAPWSPLGRTRVDAYRVSFHVPRGAEYVDRLDVAGTVDLDGWTLYTGGALRDLSGRVAISSLHYEQHGHGVDDVRADGRLEGITVDLGGLRFSNVTSDLLLADGRLTAPWLAAEFAGGRLMRDRNHLGIELKDELPIDGQLEILSADVSRLLGEETPRMRGLAGRVDAALRFHCKGRSLLRGHGLPSLEAAGRVEVRDAKLWTIPLFDKLYSAAVLPLTGSSRDEYDRADGGGSGKPEPPKWQRGRFDFALQGVYVRLSDVEFEGEPLVLRGDGTLGPEQLEMHFHPEVKTGTGWLRGLPIIGPVIGWLLSSIEHELGAFRFGGPYGNPKVTWDPVTFSTPSDEAPRSSACAPSPSRRAPKPRPLLTRDQRALARRAPVAERVLNRGSDYVLAEFGGAAVAPATPEVPAWTPSCCSIVLFSPRASVVARSATGCEERAMNGLLRARRARGGRLFVYLGVAFPAGAVRMNGSGWLQIALYVVVLIALAKPLGGFMARVFEGRPCGLDRVLGPVERGIYRACGVDAARETGWKEYAGAFLAFSLVSLLAVHALLRLQGVLPLNPEHLGAVSPDSSFNTAVSFATNTDWQGYGGETTMSWFTQMVALTVQNFVSAAAGIGGPGRADPRLRAEERAGRRQLLGRPGPLDPLRPAAALAGPRGRAGLAGRGPDVPALRPRAPAAAAEGRRRQAGRRADDRARAGGEPGRDQAARHQRRRLLQRQLGPPVREPDADVGLPRAPLDPADPGRALLHVRAHGPRSAPGAGAPRGDGGGLRAARRLLRRGRAVGQPALRATGRRRARERAAERREHGGQGGPLRHRELGAVGDGDDRGVERLGQRDARLSRRSAGSCRCG